MFKTFRFTRNIENTLMTIFIGLFVLFCCLSPDMSIESLKSVVLIGITVGIIYGLVAVGISLIYTGLDIVNFSHGEFIRLCGHTAIYGHVLLSAANPFCSKNLIMVSMFFCLSLPNSN